ncbi:MAG: group II intron maturase-specific domain-containing protein [Pseudonocardiaceae bacterium]
MRRVRARVNVLADRNRVGMELADVIAGLNLFLRGWGNAWFHQGLHQLIGPIRYPKA